MNNVGESIEDKVNDLLALFGITYAAKLIGPTMREDWECDEWRIDFERGNKRFTASFFTGTGHRSEVTNKMRLSASYGFPGLTDNDKRGRTGYGQRYLKAVEALRTPVKPKAASALYSFLLDGQAVNMCFPDWCDELGYDNDSRKALAAYEACVATGVKLRELFTYAEQKALREALQDY